MRNHSNTLPTGQGTSTGDESGAAPVDRLTWTVEEAAAALGVSVSYYYKAVRENRLPAKRLGRRLVVPKQALREFINGTEEAAS